MPTLVETTWRLPDEEDYRKVLAELEAKFEDDEKRLQNHLFWRTFNSRDGWFGKNRARNIWSRDEQGNLVRQKQRMTRREWIESHVKIRDKAGKLVPLILNAAQRRMECWVLRMERAGIPIRIIACKCRQIGYSTYAKAFELWLCVHEDYTSCLIIADTQDRARLLLQIANTARENMPRMDEDGNWEMHMRAEARYSLAWSAPFHSEIQITSSETPGAGRGGTRRVLVMDEKAFWSNAEDVMGAVGPSLPSLPGTYAFSISTANGAFGLYHDEFMAAWEMRDIPLRQRVTNSLEACAVSIFFAFYENPEYRWTRQFNQPELPEKLAEEIQASLDDEEKWILSQRYFERGRGWRQVDLDQIAWWRAALHGDVCHGDRNLRRQEYAYSVSTCFTSSGRRVFDPDTLERYAREARQPLWRGKLEPEGLDPRASRRVDDFYGGLCIWREPEESRQYVIGIDAAGGAENSDFAAAVVIDAETCEVVAIWRVRMASQPWGVACTRLGWLYNEAMLAFETFPSAFGLAAAHAAVGAGYQEVYTRHRENVATKDHTDLLGFHTNATTKPLLISRIQESLAARSPIPALGLVQELQARSYDPETGKMVGKGHDDQVMGYGIALYVRDLCWTAAPLRREPEKGTTESDRFWELRRKRRGGSGSKGRRWIA